jgi:hypothetical protein
MVGSRSTPKSIGEALGVELVSAAANGASAGYLGTEPLMLR